MARIPLLNGDDLNPEQQRVYDAIVAGPRGKVRGPMRAALHNPELADKWQQLGEVLRYRTSLPPRISELAILATARSWNCQLEWYLHEPHAARGGLEPEIVGAIRRGERPTGDDDTLAVYDFVVEMQTAKKVTAGTYDRVLERWGVVGVVELTALIGYYSMVAMTLNAHEFPLPDGAAPPLPDIR